MFSDPFTLILATLMAFAAVGILCYEAGADAGKRAEFKAHSDDALALVAEAGSRVRHPSAR
jgi:hypothetical protein